MRVAIDLPMAPQAKGRGRVVRVGGFSRIATPGKTKQWEEGAAMLIRAALPFSVPISGPVVVVIDAIHSRPKSRPSAIDRELWTPGGRVPKPTRADVDNIAKAVLDALTKARAWQDDGQVWSLTARKWYAATSERPHVEISIEW